MSCDQFNIEAVNLYFIKSENLQVFVESTSFRQLVTVGQFCCSKTEH